MRPLNLVIHAIKHLMPSDLPNREEFITDLNRIEYNIAYVAPESYRMSDYWKILCQHCALYVPADHDFNSILRRLVNGEINYLDYLPPRRPLPLNTSVPPEIDGLDLDNMPLCIMLQYQDYLPEGCLKRRALLYEKMTS